MNAGFSIFIKCDLTITYSYTFNTTLAGMLLQYNFNALVALS